LDGLSVGATITLANFDDDPDGIIPGTADILIGLTGGPGVGAACFGGEAINLRGIFPAILGRCDGPGRIPILFGPNPIDGSPSGAIPGIFDIINIGFASAALAVNLCLGTYAINPFKSSRISGGNVLIAFSNF
jgi:hypothetical protein